MSEPLDISTFEELKESQKIYFIENRFMDFITSEKDMKVVYPFIKRIILSHSESSYVRKSVLALFTELAVLGKIRTRYALTLLIDEWSSSSSDLFVELQRLRDLIVFHEESEEEIEEIYKNQSTAEEQELVSESLFNLGIIYFKKALKSASVNDYKDFVSKSEYYFEMSQLAIENRLDAIFFHKVVQILNHVFNNQWGAGKHVINELAQLLFQRDIFLIRPIISDDILFNFFQILTSLQKICNQKPSDWLDYRLELDKLKLYYSQLQNVSFVERLEKKSPSEAFSNYVKANILQPHFVLNLNDEINKIDIYLSELEEGDETYNFLFELKSIILSDSKKKIELADLEKEFIKMFPEQSCNIISGIIQKIHKPNDVIAAVRRLSEKQEEDLLAAIVFACTRLQSDMKYWGDKADENERNRYIANLVEARGFVVKDQTQWAKSHRGVKSGEIDIFIMNQDGTPRSIIEALILDSLKTDYLTIHLDKLFKYDTTGLRSNYIITYSVAKNFIQLWDKYCQFIREHNFDYTFQSFCENTNFSYCDIKIAETTHLRNNETISLNHIMLNVLYK